MKKSYILMSLLVLLAAVHFLPSPLGASQQPQPKPIEEEDQKPEGRATLRVDVNQVQVDVTVQDKKGNLITGLTEKHFKVYEDKVEQTISNFAPVEAPMTAVLVAEYRNSVPWEFLYEVWWASRYFVQGMREDDWVAIVAYDIRPEILVDFTQNKGEALNALRRLNFPAFSEANMYDAVIDMLDRLEEVEGKTALILLATGLDTFSKHNLGEFLDRTKRTNVSIYSVGIGGNFLARAEHRLNTLTRMDFYQAEATLKNIAKNTGGQAYFPRFLQAFPSIFETISALLRSQYSLSYVSTNQKRDGKYRKIKVEVADIDLDGDGKNDKLKVHYKQGYIAEEDSPG